MAEFLVSGKVTLDALDAAKGARSVGTEMERMAKSGIAGFEAAQQKVIDLTKQIGALRNELLRTNDPAAQTKLNAALQRSQTELRAAKTEMRGMSLEAAEASQKAQLLAASLGVQLPGEIGRLISRLPLLQKGLEAAFGVTIIFAFTRAVAQAATNWEKFQEGIIGALGPISELEVKIANVFGLLKGYSTEARNAAEASKHFTEAQEALADRVLKAQRDFLAAGQKGIAQMVTESNTRVILLQKEQSNADQALRSQFDLLISYEKESLARRVQAEVFEKQAEAGKKAAEATQQFAKHQEQLAWQLGQSNAALNIAIDLENKYKAVEEEAMAASSAANAVNQAGLRDLPPLIRGIYADYDIMGDKAIEAGRHQVQAAKLAQDQVEKTAQGIESFIDRVFLQARSLSDVFHQFLMQLLGNFVKWVSHMIANALLGMKQIQGSAAGGGGFWGSLLGGILGIGGAAGGLPASAATTGAAGLAASGFSPGSIGTLATLPMSGLSQSSIAAGMPTVIGAGGNVVMGGGVPTSAGGAATGFSAMAQQLGMMGALGLISGGLAIAGGSAGPIRGAIGGGMAGLGAALMVAAPFGPLGLAIIGISAAVGTLVGFIKHGRAKRKAAEAEQEYEFAANALYDQYKKWQIDYDTALGGMQGLISQGQQDLTHRGLGGAGQAGANNLTMVIQNEIRALDELRRQREQSAQFMAGMSLPEFAFGGPVSKGGILAVLHPGEFVMQKSAVDALGTNFLSALNRAPRFAEGGAVSGSGREGRSVVIHGGVNMFIRPERGMSDREAANMVIRGWRLAVMDGAL